MARVAPSDLQNVGVLVTNVGNMRILENTQCLVEPLQNNLKYKKS